MRAIFNFCFLLLALFLTLHAQEDLSLSNKEETMVVKSGEAQYNGKEIVLMGQVAVEHALGQISARRLSVLSSLTKDKKNKFGFLKISEDVHIQLKEGGELYCQQAEVDYANMQSHFSGSSAKPDVIYLNLGEEKEQRKKSSLELKSTYMTLELMRESIPSSSAKILIKQIEADQHVRVSYNHDYLLLADHALYQRASDETSSLAGLLTLTVKGDLPACTMTDLNGDRLSARVIQLNTIERTLGLSQPLGILYFRQKESPAQSIEFSSQELIWDDNQQTLLLRGEVDVLQNRSLHMYTSHALSIVQGRKEEKRTLRLLHSPQETLISYTDPQKDQVHKIYSPGPFIINHESEEMTLQGLNGRQVYIEDVLGEMAADDIRIYYKWNEKGLNPEKMVLEGNVRLASRFNENQEESGTILHYALADRVECFPTRHEIVLMSHEGNRVLFFDKVNNIQMSAPSLKILHDPTTQKNAIQGVGDVRFTFVEKELEQLKNYFSFQKELKSAKSSDNE